MVVKACTHTRTQICPCRASQDPFSFREEPSVARGRRQIKCLCHSSHLPAGKTICWFSRSGSKLRRILQLASPDRLSGLSHGVRSTDNTHLYRTAGPPSWSRSCTARAGCRSRGRIPDKACTRRRTGPPSCSCTCLGTRQQLASLPHINTTNGDSDMTDAAFENRNMCWLHDLTPPPRLGHRTFA